MKKVVFTLFLAVTVIVSGIAGYAEHSDTAEKQGDPGGAGLSIRF
ncbi:MULTISPECIES: hypothetical protein [Terribacillus]|jgi:hypothetical protein|nr:MULTISPECIES: hypothetical protein [Terribacillus]VVM35319.1 hypothetical protein [Terribacillus sp. AE2B 122]